MIVYIILYGMWNMVLICIRIKNMESYTMNLKFCFNGYEQFWKSTKKLFDNEINALLPIKLCIDNNIFTKNVDEWIETVLRLSLVNILLQMRKQHTIVHILWFFVFLKLFQLKSVTLLSTLKNVFISCWFLFYLSILKMSTHCS